MSCHFESEQESKSTEQHFLPVPLFFLPSLSHSLSPLPLETNRIILILLEPFNSYKITICVCINLSLWRARLGKVRRLL